jgi:protein gp37
VILGCESGSKRRPAPHNWFRYLRDQCAEAGVPYFLKQMGEREDGTGRVVKEPYLDGKQHLELAWEAR